MQKHSTRMPLIMVFFLLVFSLSSTGGARELSFTGVATERKTGEFAYTEIHTVSLDTNDRYLHSSVRYEGPEGELYALKLLDFRQDLLAPKLEFEDMRSNVRITTKLAGDGELLLTKTNGGREEVAKIDSELNNELVVDAGFDRLLMLNWESLLKGNEKPFHFLALSRSSTIEFELSLVSKSDTTARFEIVPSNWLVRLLVEPIILDYDRHHRRLVRYEGVTNIEKVGTDRNYDAVISYRYKEPSA